MGISDDLKNLGGILTVQVEGFFTERFINLCKINNIRIWNVRTIVKGVVRFKINIKEFKKLRKIARKTKCKVKIKEKEGLYFKLFKYRKRKLAVFLLFFAILFSVIFSTFVWRIDITGNVNLSEDKIREALKESNLYIGKNKFCFNKKDVINNLRINLNEISWVGIEINGTTARVEIVEKTLLSDDEVQNKNPGDIVAEKSGVITKIVAENGTAKYKIGSYVEKGSILIEGNIYSKTLEPVSVAAKGIVSIDSLYQYQNTYRYKFTEKEYTKKKRYFIGFRLNSKEIMLNYLNKNKKYDISKSSNSFNIFGNSLSFDLYKCEEYGEKEVIRSKNEILEEAKKDSLNYINSEVLSLCCDGKIIDEIEYIKESEDGIFYKVDYTINERIGKFVERNINE